MDNVAICRDILKSVPHWVRKETLEQEWAGVLAQERTKGALGDLAHDPEEFVEFFGHIALTLEQQYTPLIAEFLFVESGSDNDHDNLEQTLHDFRMQPMDWLEKVAQDLNECVLWRIAAELLLATRIDIQNVRQMRKEQQERQV
jgi:hypothetical protein